MLASITSAAAVADHAQRWGGPGGPWPLALLVPLVWAVLLVVVVMLVRQAMRRRPFVHAAAAGESALATRFANGDIDEGEYRARLGVLRAERTGR